MKYERIFLIGFMGAGKSTYGRQLADVLGWAFADTDNWIERQTSQTIPQIFTQAGEAVFREWETQALQAVLPKSNVVIATGGGLPVNPVHQDQMRSHGLVIWLNTSWETILKRLRAMKDRPLVDHSNADWEANMQQLYESRLPAYRNAHLIIDPERWSAERLGEWLTAQVKIK